MEKPKILESQVQQAIIQYLTIKKYLWWRNNAGYIFLEDRGKKRLIKLGIIGSPDIYLLKKGKLYGLEIKSPTGKLSEAQEAFRQRFESNGGVYVVVRSISDMESII